MILPKKTDIDKSKQQEKEQLIKDGISLATKVDKLRETSANEERQLKDWRESSLKIAQADIAKFIEEKETLKNEILEIERLRDSLLLPDIKQVHEEIKQIINSEVSKRTAYLSSASLKKEMEDLKTEREKVSILITEIKKRNEETNKAKEEAISLKESTQHEYEIAHSEHSAQTETYDKEMSEVAQKEEEYEVALSLIKIRENEVKEKELDIINREKHLASQRVALQIAMEEIKKYGTINH